MASILGSTFTFDLSVWSLVYYIICHSCSFIILSLGIFLGIMPGSLSCPTSNFSLSLHLTVLVSIKGEKNPFKRIHPSSLGAAEKVHRVQALLAGSLNSHHMVPRASAFSPLQHKVRNPVLVLEGLELLLGRTCSELEVI